MLPDGALALTLPDASAVVRLDPVTGAVERLHQFPLSETLGESTVLPDGRVALRVEQWLGELDGRLVTRRLLGSRPAQPRPRSSAARTSS